jgi:NADPH-dependent curcumin reductase CurA
MSVDTTAAWSFQQTARPQGAPAAEQFTLVKQDLPEPADDEALVANVYLSVDPYMRQLMDGGWPLDAPLGRGRAIGRVVASRSTAFAEGDLVIHNGGWSTHAIVKTGQVGARVIDPAPGVRVSTYLAALGGTGLTAYAGVRAVLGVGAGDTVYISSAAGAVGGVAGQICRLLGAERVVGATGTAAKARHVRDRLGFDAAFDYHAGPLADLLAEAAPDGITAALEGVGGPHLEAVIGACREFGRIAWVGAIAQYNTPDDPPAAPANLYAVSYNSLQLRGFQVRHHGHLRQEMEEWMIPHLRSGRLVSDEQITTGFEHTVETFLSVLSGGNTGKALVQVADL